MRRQVLALAGCLLAGCLLVPGDSLTAAPSRPHFLRVGMDVLVDGQPVRTITHRGRTYLPVPRMGAEYTIRVWNQGPRRITAIVSVDGLSVINGKPASEAHPGYIVEPYGQVVIKGWRRSMDTVAAFRFVDREESYARLMGHPENIGVIGLVAFEEQGTGPLIPEEKDRAAPTSARRLAGGVGSVGTGYGREVDSGIYYVPFLRSANKWTVTYYYDTAEALRRAGVPVDQPPMPVPFPGSDEFAPPPPGYKGR